MNATSSMASYFQDNVSPSVVWIVGTVHGDTCWLNFPAPSEDEKHKYPNVLFSYRDANEAYLDLFDQHGVRVWLQVEPSGADVSTLIDMVLQRYSSHPSVVGFGVDGEW